MANQNKRDRKAQKSKARSKGRKSDKPPRKPKQRGRIKKALNAREEPKWRMRSEPPMDMRIEAETERLLKEGNISNPVLAKQVATWRVKNGKA